MTLLALIATAYGLLGAASSLLEAARLRKSGRADQVSLAFLGVLMGGYLVWLLYGISTGDEALILTDAVGLAAGTTTLSTAVRLRRGESPDHHHLGKPDRSQRAGAAAGTTRSVELHGTQQSPHAACCC